MPEITAYHESGHALIAVLSGAQVEYITIEPENDELPDRYGDTRVLWELARFSQKELYEKMVKVALAGPVAEMIYTGDAYHPGHIPQWAEDWREAWTQAASLKPNEQQRMRYLEQTTASLYHQIKQDQYWAALAAIADELLAHETIEGEQILDVVQHWLG